MKVFGVTILGVELGLVVSDDTRQAIGKASEALARAAGKAAGKASEALAKVAERIEDAQAEEA